MRRSVLTVLPIEPNAVLLTEFVGGARLTVFRTLNASARNCRSLPSHSAKTLDAERSTSLNPGARSVFTPAVPKPVVSSSPYAHELLSLLSHTVLPLIFVETADGLTETLLRQATAEGSVPNQCAAERFTTCNGR